MGTVTTTKTTTFAASLEGDVDRLAPSGSETFSTLRSGAGTDAITTEAAAFIIGSTTTNQFVNLQRGVALYNTSSIVSGAIIDSAFITLPPLISGQNKTGVGTTTLEVVSSNPASNGALVPADYATLGSTSYCSIAQGSLSSSINNVLTLTNLTNVIPNGFSKFGFVLGWDLNNNFTGTWGSNQSTGVAWLPGSTLTVSYHFTSPALAITGIGSTISNITSMATA